MVKRPDAHKIPPLRVFPPGAPAHMVAAADYAGLKPHERKGLAKLAIMPDGELEVRETETVERDGKPRTLLRNREVFDFTDGRSKLRMLLDIRGIKDAVAEEKVPYEVRTTYPDMDFYLEQLQGNHIEEEHLARIDARRLEVPGIYIIWPTGEMLLVDGVHRAIKRFRMGLTTFRVVVLRTNVWQGFLLDWANTELILPDGRKQRFEEAFPKLERRS